MANHCPESFSSFKDVISISWFPYNWSQTLLCYVNGVKYSKWYSIAKGMTTFHDKNCFKTKKVKMQQNKKKANLKITIKHGNRSHDLWHRITSKPTSQLHVLIIYIFHPYRPFCQRQLQMMSWSHIKCCSLVLM